MTYAIGTNIDLTHLNKKVPERVEESTQQAVSLYDIGTQLVFRFQNNHLVTARKINVAFA